MVLRGKVQVLLSAVTLGIAIFLVVTALGMGMKSVRAVQCGDYWSGRYTCYWEWYQNVMGVDWTFADFFDVMVGSYGPTYKWLCHGWVMGILGPTPCPSACW